MLGGPRVDGGMLSHSCSFVVPLHSFRSKIAINHGHGQTKLGTTTLKSYVFGCNKQREEAKKDHNEIDGGYKLCTQLPKD